jgi:hypothetical protein
MEAGDKLTSLMRAFDEEINIEDPQRSTEVVDYIETTDSLFAQYGQFTELYKTAKGELRELFLRHEASDGSYLHMSLSNNWEYANVQFAQISNRQILYPVLVIQERDFDNHLIQMYLYTWNEEGTMAKRQNFPPEFIAKYSIEAPPHSAIRIKMVQDGREPDFYKNLPKNDSLVAAIDSARFEDIVGVNNLPIRGVELSKLTSLLKNSQPIHSSLVY